MEIEHELHLWESKRLFTTIPQNYHSTKLLLSRNKKIHRWERVYKAKVFCVEDDNSSDVSETDFSVSHSLFMPPPWEYKIVFSTLLSFHLNSVSLSLRQIHTFNYSLLYRCIMGISRWTSYLVLVEQFLTELCLLNLEHFKQCIIFTHYLSLLWIFWIEIQAIDTLQEYTGPVCIWFRSKDIWQR